MEHLSMCRICLATDVRLRSISRSLQNMYERITAMTFKRDDKRPLVACYICHARLRNCYQLASCLQREKRLTRMQSSRELLSREVSSMVNISLGQNNTERRSPEVIHDSELDQQYSIDVKMEPQEEHTQTDDGSQCSSSYSEDPLEVTRNESDDVETDVLALKKLAETDSHLVKEPENKNIPDNLTATQSTIDVSPAETNQVTTNEVFDGDQSIPNQNIIIRKLNDQEQILQNLVECVQKVTQKVAELSVQLEECLVKVLENYEQPVSATLLKDINEDENESCTFKQITQKEHLDNLEKNLTNKAERTKLQKQFSFLFQPCEGSGLTCAYKLLDCMMSRDFLCLCSWSGGSRGNMSKIPLKIYKNFIKFFCDVIRSWDQTFTMEQTEQFFKRILKNSLKRRAMLDVRTSTKRTRKSNPKPKVNINKGNLEKAAAIKEDLNILEFTYNVSVDGTKEGENKKDKNESLS